MSGLQASQSPLRTSGRELLIVHTRQGGPFSGPSLSSEGNTGNSKLKQGYIVFSFSLKNQWNVFLFPYLMKTGCWAQEIKEEI
jgi:hypothetical protein